MSETLSRRPVEDLTADCIQCGMCIATCPSHVVWSDELESPRGRIHLMELIFHGSTDLPADVSIHFDRCLGCLACVSSCPSEVQYGRLIEHLRTRVEEEVKRPLADRLVRRLIFATFPYSRRMRAALTLARLADRMPVPSPLRPLIAIVPPWRSSERPAELLRPTSMARARVGLLTGCVQSVLFGNVNTATARVLAEEGFEVVAPRAQACCGALAAHAGLRERGRVAARKLIEVFEKAEADLIVVNAAGCGSHLKGFGEILADDPEYAGRAARFSARVRDVHELLAEAAPRARRVPLPLRVAFQDACHLLHAQKVRDAPRRVLQTIPELVLVELEEQDLCCGSAGIYNIVQFEAASELGRRKARHVAAAAADAYAAPNPGCLIQVTAALRRSATALPAFHPIELLDASIRGIDADVLLAGARR